MVDKEEERWPSPHADLATVSAESYRNGIADALHAIHDTQCYRIGAEIHISWDCGDDVHVSFELHSLHPLPEQHPYTPIIQVQLMISHWSLLGEAIATFDDRVRALYAAHSPPEVKNERPKR